MNKVINIPNSSAHRNAEQAVEEMFTYHFPYLEEDNGEITFEFSCHEGVKHLSGVNRYVQTVDSDGRDWSMTLRYILIEVDSRCEKSEVEYHDHLSFSHEVKMKFVVEDRIKISE